MCYCSISYSSPITLLVVESKISSCLSCSKIIQSGQQTSIHRNNSRVYRSSRLAAEKHLHNHTTTSSPPMRPHRPLQPFPPPLNHLPLHLRPNPFLPLAQCQRPILPLRKSLGIQLRSTRRMNNQSPCFPSRLRRLQAWELAIGIVGAVGCAWGRGAG